MLHWQDRLSRKLTHLQTTWRTQQARRRLGRLGASLGRDCVIAGRHRITLASGARLSIGDRVFLGDGVSIDLGSHGDLSIEAGVCLREGCVVRCNGRMVIGRESFLGNGVICECYGRIVIEEQVLLAPQVHLYDFDHGTLDCDTPMMQQPCVIGSITVGAGSWLGAKATLTRDVRVGAGAVVGAHAVVTRDVPDRAVAVGIPARVLRYRSPEPHASAARPAPGFKARSGKW